MKELVEDNYYNKVIILLYLCYSTLLHISKQEDKLPHTAKGVREVLTKNFSDTQSLLTLYLSSCL